MSASRSADNGAAAASGPPPPSHLPSAYPPYLPSAAAVDDEDVAIADLFQQSQQTCATQQRQQQRRGQQPTQPTPQPQPQPQPQLHSQRTQLQQPQSNDAASMRHNPIPAASAASSSSRGSGGALSADSVFSSIPGPIRRLWLQSHRSADPHRSKRRRFNAATVDLTVDERLEEWQRAADGIAARQPSWRTMLAQHRDIQTLLDSSQPPSSSACSSVPCLLVRVDSLVSSSYSPSAPSSWQLQLVDAAKRQLHAAGVLRGRVDGMDVATDSGGLLSGYHAARLSDGRGSVTGDVHDSLCRSVSGSSIGGVLSVGCYVLLRDVTLLSGSDGRPPHLVVQRYNVCAVQQPPQMDADDAPLKSDAAHSSEADTAAAHAASSTQHSVSSLSAADVSSSSAAVAPAGSVPHGSILQAEYREVADPLDALDWGDD